MQVFRSTAILAPYSRRSVSAKTLRMWCAPEIILGVTTLSDEQALLPHIINQARQGAAKIILAQAGCESGARKYRMPSPEHPAPGITETREAIERMAGWGLPVNLFCCPGRPNWRYLNLCVRSASTVCCSGWRRTRT
jgi:hypothetical protein